LVIVLILFYLLNYDFAYIVEQGFGINVSTNSVVWCKIKTTTTIQSLHLIFLATICLAAFDQFLSIHYLYTLRQMSTRKFSQNLLLSSLSLIILHMILSLIFFDLHSQFYLVRRQVPMERRQFDRQLTAMTFARMIAYICLGVAYSLFRISTVQTPINIDNSL